MYQRAAITGCIGLALAGCGATQNFEGVYSGPITRTKTGQAGTASEERWVITSPDDSWPSKHNYSVLRIRGSERCAIPAHHSGGYRLALELGKTCTLDGDDLVLHAASFSGGTNSGSVNLEWARSDGTIAMVETGVLQKK